MTMTVAAQPLMVEVRQTPPELRGARCTDCKTPLALLHGRAFRGVSPEGRFVIEALCMKCVDRERWIVNKGLNLPRPRVYRRRSAIALLVLSALSAGLGVATAVATVFGLAADPLVVVTVAASPLALLVAPGLYLYRQGITQTKSFTHL